MLVLGIDPGIARVGWGFVNQSGGEITAAEYGCLTTPAGLSDETRLARISAELGKIIDKYRPQVVAVEKLFFTTNAKTAFQVGQARGVIVLAASTRQLPVFSYTPLQVKMAITGYGKAEKQQIQKMVKSILKLKTVPKPDDTADALAIAITHCFTKRFD